MSKKVALLHTSMVFIQRERLIYDIFAELLPDVELINIIDDSLLRDVAHEGKISVEITRRMCYYILAAEAMGADAVFNMCSSLGPTIDTARKLTSMPVVKIDDGMAELAATAGRRIGILATVPTTLPPTTALILEKAAAAGREVETREWLSQGAFNLLMNNQVEKHNDMVIKTAKQAAEWADILVLAQCSMARLAPRLEAEVGCQVLSSPRPGVEHLRSILESQPA
ncbi:MAG: aspartate/glutamate racemase family protein [Anaerolineales bacterium]|jgi:Asp/Glu/hydantoin racemase|nr:aspartate/glutamate racemase family protein [Anaerolineales bacterium]